jgi:hypothetical protein
VVVLHPPAEQQPQLVATTPVATADLLVALISVGPDGQAYWAQRLMP